MNEEIRKLEERVKNGDTDAMYNLAYMYQYGNGVDVNYTKAIELYEKAANLGNSSAMNNLAFMYERGKGVDVNYAKAIELLERATDLGNSDAMYNLAFMYQYGEGVAVNYAKAIELYEKAAGLGNSNAMNNLGYMYEIGKGVAVNYAKAIELYEKAVGLGNSTAMFNLGDMYEHGKGADVNYAKAIELYKQAIAKGNANSEDIRKHLKKLEAIQEILQTTFQTKESSTTDQTRVEETTEDYKETQIKASQQKQEREELRELTDKLSKKYIGRNPTIRLLITNIYHNQKVIQKTTSSEEARQSIGNILLISSTGGGKTAIINDVAKKFNLPCEAVSLNQGFTAAGYVGLNLQDIFANLIKAANGDIQKAQKGIIILDEFDKIRINASETETRNIGFNQILQKELLAYIEGKVIDVEINQTRKVKFDTSELTFIFAGAFQDITERSDVYSPESIINMSQEGYMPELLARINIQHYMPKYTKQDYIDILTKSEISPLQNFAVTCSMYEKNLITSPYSPFIESVAEEAVNLDQGVRGLNNIFANIRSWFLEDLIYSDEDILLLEPYDVIKRRKEKTGGYNLWNMNITVI